MGKQEFIAVQCFQCSAFQVQQVKFSNKFSCSVCHAKQSVQRTFARSHQAKDVREVVQVYNNARSNVEREEDLAGTSRDWAAEAEAAYSGASCLPLGGESKWSTFHEEDNEAWTVVLPERQAAAGRAAGGGAKRKRAAQQQHQEQPSFDGDWEPHESEHQRHSRQRPAAPRQALGHTNYQSQGGGRQAPGQASSAQKEWQPAGGAGSGQGALHNAANRPGQQAQPTGRGAGRWASFVLEDD